MYRSLAVLPLHLACQIFIANNYSSNSSLNVSLANDTQLPKLATDLPNGYTVYPDIGVAFKVYESKLPWDDARKICVSEGGNLAMTDSFTKIKTVMGLKKAESDLWVGFHRMFDITEWTDVKTGLPAPSIPWGSWNTYEADMNRTCLQLWRDGTGLWAVNCTEKHPFVCEVAIFGE